MVRRIFRLAVERHGPYEISKMLTAEKVECPGYYLAKQRAKQKKQGKKSGTSMLDKNRPYCLTIERETKQCFSHNVSTKALTELVLETIRTTASYAIQNKEEFIQKVRSISQVRQQEAAKELKRKVAKAKKRIAELDMLIKKLYETYAMGKLEEKRFEMLSAEYEKEQDELEQALASAPETEDGPL